VEVLKLTTNMGRCQANKVAQLIGLLPSAAPYVRSLQASPSLAVVNQGGEGTCTSFALVNIIQDWLVSKYGTAMQLEATRAVVSDRLGGTAGLGVADAFSKIHEVRFRSMGHTTRPGNIFQEEDYWINVDFRDGAEITDFEALHATTLARQRVGLPSACVVTVKTTKSGHAQHAVVAAWAGRSPDDGVLCQNSWGACEPLIRVMPNGKSQGTSYVSHVEIIDVVITKATLKDDKETEISPLPSVTPWFTAAEHSLSSNAKLETDLVAATVARDAAVRNHQACVTERDEMKREVEETKTSTAAERAKLQKELEKCEALQEAALHDIAAAEVTRAAAEAASASLQDKIAAEREEMKRVIRVAKIDAAATDAERTMLQRRIRNGEAFLKSSKAATQARVAELEATRVSLQHETTELRRQLKAFHAAPTQTAQPSDFANISTAAEAAVVPTEDDWAAAAIIAGVFGELHVIPKLDSARY
jgi:predicted  nucleic acid-binding Zn-ribbon protein